MNKALVLIPLIVSTVLTFTTPIYAQEILQPTIIIPSLSPTPVQQEVDYTLPYPGILPDNPLYFLKAFRDKMISMFISNPSKKAEFDLLQADKRLNMGVYLINQQKQSLAPTIISKGENYFDEGIGQLTEAKTEKIDIKNEAQTYYAASQKHIEVLNQLKKKVSIATKKALQHEEDRVINFQKRIKKLEK